MCNLNNPFDKFLLLIFSYFLPNKMGVLNEKRCKIYYFYIKCLQIIYFSVVESCQLEVDVVVLL